MPQKCIEWNRIGCELNKKGLKGKMALFWICWRNLARAQDNYKNCFPFVRTLKI